MRTAAELVAYKVERLDPLWSSYKTGSSLSEILGTDYLTAAGGKAATSYGDLSGEWYAEAIPVLQATPEGLQQHTLAITIDEVVANRSELVSKGFILKSPINAAAETFTREVRERFTVLQGSTKLFLVGLAIVAIIALARR